MPRAITMGQPAWCVVCGDENPRRDGAAVGGDYRLPVFWSRKPAADWRAEHYPAGKLVRVVVPELRKVS